MFTNKNSSNVLSNLYNPNEGAPIVEENLSNYDNPSQKWKLTKVDENWYRIENKSNSNSNSCLQVENDSRSDGAKVIQGVWSNKDSQLWGAQLVQSYDPMGVNDLNFKLMTVVPTIIEETFEIVGDGYDTVEILTIAGISVEKFRRSKEYNVSGLSSGCYFVEIKNNGQIVGRYKIVKK